MADDDSVVRVTIRDVWLETRAVGETVAETGRTLADLAGRFERLVERDAEADRVHQDHETRLRALEVWRWKAAGVVAFLAFVVAPLATLLAVWLSHVLAHR